MSSQMLCTSTQLNMLMLSTSIAFTGANFRLAIVLTVFCLAARCTSVRSADSKLQVGVAAIDITPDYPVRLNGFGGRRQESEGVTQRIWAKALAFADEREGPAIIITADNLCVSDEITSEVAERLKRKVGLKRERLAITTTHTHTAPMLTGVSPTLFGTDIPAEHQAHIDQYTREFIDKLEQVAQAAVKDIKPARLSWGTGEVRFAVNRRTAGGPVDHDFSVLVIRTEEGSPRAVYFSYACHCVTLSHNKISGDWAGYAQEAVQKLFPGVIALASVGCGADSNPKSGVTGTNLVVCAEQGQEIADEVKRLLAGELRPISAVPTIRFDRVDLPLDTARTRAEWEERTRSSQYAVAYHARLNLARLDGGEKLPTKLNYPIQTWIFGDQLAMLFLPGETVVDYSLRMKREFDRKRLWINAYANDGRCYIPSERVLKEGGYEGGDAMIYYDRPQRFAPGVEQRIFEVVYKQFPKSFSSANRTEGIRPLSPAEALRSIHTKPGLDVDLVAAEPLIADPVAIDWGADGRLWVCEMNDYPAGTDGNWLPGGRVKLLEDTDGDGRYDKATLFADKIPFPTGVTAWGAGVFICAAPDILFAEDTNHDGKADRIEKVFSGFATDNYQARVNSLQLGLDNWIYGANGLLGGSITSHRAGFPLLKSGVGPATGAEVNIRNRDFRFSPFTGEFETATGLSQQGRGRDDSGNWFGCDNSDFVLSFGLAENYVRRNPLVTLPATVKNLSARPDGNRLYPRSRLLERFNDLDNANRTTSACGFGIYRDTLLGEEYYGNAFVCEVVHNLVHREVIREENGVVSSTRPADDETSSEFLASTDNWFRPAQVRTGPDGALYVVDMYRFLIEHPRWIPAARLAKIDVRAGSDMGRIYRVRPRDKKLRPIRDLTKLTGTELGAAMDSPNGTERDRVQIELLTRRESAATAQLSELAQRATLGTVRAQALCALDGLGGASPALLTKALRDPEALVREQALRISEPYLRYNPEPELGNALLALTNDSSAMVIKQLALTLGEWNNSRAGEALAILAIKFKESPQLQPAILTSARTHCAPLLNAFIALPQNTRGRKGWIFPLVATAAGSENDKVFGQALELVATSKDSQADEFLALAPVIQAMARRNMTLAEFLTKNSSLRAFEQDLQRILKNARTAAIDENMPVNVRAAALDLFDQKMDSLEDLDMLCSLAARAEAEKVRSAALAALRRQANPSVAERMVGLWAQITPVARAPIAALLLSRDGWALRLLEAVRQGKVQPNEISPGERQIALNHANQKIRELAAELFGSRLSAREEVLAKYKQVSSLTGDKAKGRELFAQNCASCHLSGAVGADVGPNLATLRDKDVDYWLKNILDPNAVVEPRFVAYEVELNDDRSLTGVIKSETPNSLVLRMGGGTTETISRSEIKSVRASRLSLMPEGLEAAISPEGLADLIAFLKDGVAAPQPESSHRGSPELVLRDPASVARLILDPAQPNELRTTAIGSNPQFASELIREMTRDLVPGSPEEYARIPWIWRVAIAAGKRNDSEQLRRILVMSLPEIGQPLRDWQAVVIGGGLINAVSQRGVWPRERFQDLVERDPELKQRWQHTLELATAMADNPNVPSGTRYDALRLLGVETWSKSGAQLNRYLGDKNGELQMGAVSALGDMQNDEAVRVLSEALPRLARENQKLAAAALLRTTPGRSALLEAIQANRIARAEVNEEMVAQLRSDPDEKIRAKAIGLLQK